MKSGAQNKKKARQSSKKANYYKTQAIRTARNKLRRKLKREKRAAHWANVRAAAAKLTPLPSC